jgi:hypothetical protein
MGELYMSKFSSICHEGTGSIQRGGILLLLGFIAALVGVAPTSDAQSRGRHREVRPRDVKATPRMFHNENCQLQPVRPANTIYLSEFGATGNGRSDDYAAMKAAAAYVSSNPGTTLIYEPGTYAINRYVRMVWDEDRVEQSIHFKGCRNVKIVGCSAKVEVQGNFHRTADIPIPGTNLFVSRVHGVVPFLFNKCSNFTLRGFELDGKATNMTRDEGVVEGFSYGVATIDSQDYTIEDIYTHNFGSDGIILGIGTTGDRRATVNRVTSRYNARNNMSVIGLRTGTISNSYFLDAGRTNGTYPPHAPGAGLDIEPDYEPFAKNTFITERTGDIRISNCTFQNNLGSQLVSVVATSVSDVTISNSKIISANDSSPYPVILAIDTGILENSYINTGDNGMIYPSWHEGNAKHPERVLTVLRGNRIETKTSGIVSVDVQQRVIIENNDIIGLPRNDTRESYLPFVRNPLAEFRGNRVFFPKEWWYSRDNYQYTSLIQNALISEDNQFQTSLDPQSNRRFLVDYTGTKTVADEVFPLDDRIGPMGLPIVSN